MTENAIAALCAQCGVPLEFVADHEAKDWFACPRCGTGDTRERILSEANDHAVELVKVLTQEAIGRGVGRGKGLQFQSERVNKRRYRFILNTKP